MALCPACGEDNPARAKFCLECGSPIGTRGGGEERKVVTVLFADMVGFTSRSESLDVEDVHGTLQPYHELLRSELERHGGTVEKFIGDAVMALFGAPVSHEDDPERAVRAALAIQEVVAGVRDDDSGPALHVRIGVNTGEALVVLDALPSEGSGMAFGDVVNTAARLQTAAPIDGVLVGEATYRATRRTIEYRRVPPVSAKGKAEPVGAWVAERARSRFGSDVEPSPATSLVGRDGELRVLREALDRAREARAPHLVTVIGAPGIGKSRLVAELFRVLDQEDDLVNWRQGRSLPYDEPVAFWALADIVKAQAGIQHSDSSQVAGHKLHDAVASLIQNDTDAARVERSLRRLLGLESGVEETGRERAAAAFAAWRHFIEALAAQRPTVLAFEDLHWADDGLLEFIGHVMEWVTDVPLLVICTARPELLDRDGWGGSIANSTTLDVTPLSSDETARLVSALLEQAALPAETQQALFERSGGNALYAQEYVRMLIDRGLLVRRERGWTRASDEPLPMPETIQGLISGRLDALPRDEKEVLQHAAVLGKVVWVGAVADLCGRDRSETDELLGRAAGKHLLRRVPISEIEGETEFAFPHALIRDVAYAALTRKTRAQVHERAADWIESLPSEREDRPQLVAHHLLEAQRLCEATGADSPELRERAGSVAIAAGDHALAVNAFAAAEDYYARALALLDPAHERCWHARIGLGRARLYRADIVEPDFERAALAPPEGTPSSEAALLLAELAVWRLNHGQVDPAFELADRAIALAEGELPSAATSFVYGSLGSMLAIEEHDLERGLALQARGMEIAEAVGAKDLLAANTMGIGCTRFLAGDVGGAVRDLRRSVDLARETTSVWSVLAFLNTGNVFVSLGDLDAAQALYEEGLASSRSLGSGTFLPYLRQELAEVMMHRGRWDEVPSLADPDIGFATHRMEMFARREQAALDRFRSAGDLFEQRVEHRREVRALRAHCLVRLGAVDEAGDAVREALDLAATGPGCTGCAAIDLAVASLMTGQAEPMQDTVLHQRLATPWSEGALRVLGRDWEAALGAMRTIGTIPYEAAVLECAARDDGTPVRDRIAYATRSGDLLKGLASS